MPPVCTHHVSGPMKIALTTSFCCLIGPDVRTTLKSLPHIPGAGGGWGWGEGWGGRREAEGGRGSGRRGGGGEGRREIAV